MVTLPQYAAPSRQTSITLEVRRLNNSKSPCISFVACHKNYMYRSRDFVLREHEKWSLGNCSSARSARTHVHQVNTLN